MMGLAKLKSIIYFKILFSEMVFFKKNARLFNFQASISQQINVYPTKTSFFWLNRIFLYF
jgi:hypothetical protein